MTTNTAPPWWETIPTWHGHPIDADQHPERPWWRKGEIVRCDASGEPLFYRWTRTDGAITEGTDGAPVALFAHDRDHPLAPPPPRGGQVWLTLLPGKEPPEGVIVTRAGVPYIMSPTGVLGPEMVPLQVWPPPHSVLVAGAFAPWAPAAQGEEP